MAVTFHIPGPLQSLTHGQRSVQLNISPKSVAEALEALFTLYPGVRDRLFTEHGSVREHINVLVGKEDIRYMDGLATKLTDPSEIVILPAVSGGSPDYDLPEPSTAPLAPCLSLCPGTED